MAPTIVLSESWHFSVYLLECSEAGNDHLVTDCRWGTAGTLRERDPPLATEILECQSMPGLSGGRACPAPKLGKSLCSFR